MNLDGIKPSKNVEDRRKRAPVYVQAATAFIRRREKERNDGPVLTELKKDLETMNRGTIFKVRRK